jgi:ABC-2 type transport system permease protein
MQDINTFLLLLRPKTKGFLRLGRTGDVRHPLRILVFGGLGLLFAVGIYSGSLWFLHKCLDVELIGTLIPRKLMSMVLIILVSILLISATISSFAVLFLSDDLVLLFASPIPKGPLYYARFVEMVVHSSWMVIFFGLPVFLAYGAAFGSPISFYFWVAILFVGLILIPTSIGAVISALLTSLFSARRSRDLMVILVVLGFISLYLVIRAMRPEQLLEEESFGTMMEFINMFRATESELLPTSWMTDVLFSVLQRKQMLWLPAMGLWTTALALVVISGWICTALYGYGLSRAQEGRVRSTKVDGNSRSSFEKGRLLGSWLDRLGKKVRGLTGVLLVKDLRVFMRDTNQWLQLLLLGALAVVYLLNFVYLKVANFSWFTLYTVNHVLLGLVLSGIAVRFVFPAVSLEGRAWWIIRIAPLELSSFLHSKLLIHFVPLALLASFLSILSCSVIGIPLGFAVVSLAQVLGMSLGVCTLGVGIGAIYPKFKAENPAKIPTGVGGVAFMITSMSFVIAFLLATFYPTFVLYDMARRQGGSIGRSGWLITSLVITVFLLISASWLPMWLARKKLEQRDD